MLPNSDAGTATAVTFAGIFLAASGSIFSVARALPSTLPVEPVTSPMITLR